MWQNNVWNETSAKVTTDKQSLALLPADYSLRDSNQYNSTVTKFHSFAKFVTRFYNKDV